MARWIMADHGLAFPATRETLSPQRIPRKPMRYVLSVARHYLTGKLTTEHAVYALRERPVAVASKGKTWVIDPDFKG